MRETPGHRYLQGWTGSLPLKSPQEERSGEGTRGSVPRGHQQRAAVPSESSRARGREPWPWGPRPAWRSGIPGKVSQGPRSPVKGQGLQDGGTWQQMQRNWAPSQFYRRKITGKPTRLKDGDDLGNPPPGILVTNEAKGP